MIKFIYQNEKEAIKMKKNLCLLFVLCMMVTVLYYPVAAAETVLYNFYENVDIPFSCDLDGDGKDDSFSVDYYTNYFQRFVFVINGNQHVFAVERHGGYGDFAITDIDETDGFKDIIVIGYYKNDWIKLYRYDGGKLLEHTDSIGVPDSENDEHIEITAGGGDLIVKRGNEVVEYSEFSFKDAEIFTEDDIKDWYEDGTDYNGYPIEFNGERMQFDQVPINKNDRILVPIRAIFEKMGYSMTWDAETRTAHALKNEDTMSVQIGNKTIFYNINGVAGTYECDVAPLIVGGRTMIPLRGVAESAGCNVNWCDDGVVRITTN